MIMWSERVNLFLERLIDERGMGITGRELLAEAEALLEDYREGEDN